MKLIYCKNFITADTFDVQCYIYSSAEYNEDPEIPAYKNDKRFDTLTFNWIDSNFSKYYCEEENKKKKCLSFLYSTLNESIVHKKTENLKKGDKAMLISCVLNKQDLYCLKCIEPIASDATILWFINFLIYKDMQSNFNFLKTCLVDTMYSKKCTNPLVNLNYFERKKYHFDFVINQ